MNISLVVTSYDRQRDLDRFARGIAQQTSGGDIELIFVAQGGARILIPNECPATIRVVERPAASRIPLSKARNIGVQFFGGDIIGFPDDDCWYEPDLLCKVVQYFDDHPDVDCICTNVFDPERQLSYGKRPIGVVQKVSFLNLFRLPTSAGMFIRRGAFLKIGGCFNEFLGVGTRIGSGEEIEVVARLLSESLTVHYVGSIQVYHPVLAYSPSDIAKNYQYGMGFGYLNGLLIKGGHLLVAIFFCEIVARSCVGMVKHVFRPINRSVYSSRLRGIISGFRAGWSTNAQ